MKYAKFITAVLVAFFTASTLSAQSTGFSAHVGYSPLTFKQGSDSENWTGGLRVGVAAGRYVSTGVPLYVDYGLNFNYAWDSDNGTKENYLSAEIPANIGYQINVKGSSVAFSPYGGLSGRVNILAEKKISGNSYNHFDGDDSSRWKRFQLGVQLGLKIVVGDKYIIGYEFNPNVTEIKDNRKTTFNTFFVGIKF